jgi:hypothetical protein
MRLVIIAGLGPDCKPSRARGTSVLVLLGALAGCGPGINPALLLPDAGAADGPAPGDGPSSCGSAPLVATTTISCEAGGFDVVLPSEASSATVSLKGAPAGYGLLLYDFDDRMGDTSGFVLAMPTSTSDLWKLSTDFSSRVAGSAAFTGATLAFSGIATKDADGQTAVAEVLLEVSVSDLSEPNEVRNSLLGILLKGATEPSGSLPIVSQEHATTFVVGFSVSPRTDTAGARFGVAVVSQKSFSNPTSHGRARLLDAASGTDAATRGRKAASRCERIAFTPARQVDFLFVVDATDSDSMGETRIDLHQAAATFWSRAQAVGLDFRAGVASMGIAKSGGGARPAAKLCSPKAGPECPLPGSPRFFGPDESDLACFKLCLLRPQGEDPRPAGTLGIESARGLALSMLPRRSSDTLRLRPSALLIIVLVSDQVDGGVASLFGGKVPTPPLDSAQQQALDGEIAPLVDLLLGRSNARNVYPSGARPQDLSGSALYAIAPDPDRGCGDSPPLGTAEIAAATKGFSGSICDGELDTLVELLVDEAATRTTPIPLAHAPIRWSLGAAMDGRALLRTSSHGFDYHDRTRSLLLLMSSSELPSSRTTVEVGYQSY